MIRYLLVRSIPDSLEFFLVQDSGETIEVVEKLTINPNSSEITNQISSRHATAPHPGDEVMDNESTDDSSLSSGLASDNIRSILSKWDYSYCAAVVSDPTSGNTIIELPFSNKTKIDQVVPLQLQDLLPLDSDDYLCCNRLIYSADNNLNIVSTSYIQEDVIAGLLDTLSNMDIKPRYITTDSSLLPLIASNLWPDTLQEPYIVFSALDDISYVAALVDSGQCAEIREGRSKSKTLVGDILLFATSIYSRRKLKISHALAINYETLDARLLALPEITNETTPYQESDIKISDVASGKIFAAPLWAHGLFMLLSSAREITSLVDFRVGPYSYRAMLHNFISAIKGEATYLALAAIIGISWVGTQLYGVEHKINLINERIASGIKAVFPDDIVAQDSEMSYLDAKLTDVQSQLSDTGNISSLSPLESLKKLSESIDRQSDVAIEKMNLSYGSITFRGTALDLPTVGKLETTLSEIEGFCSAQVKPKGKAPGGTRYQFDAELTPCDIPVNK
ncbi:MAG: hypothetical protein PHC51_12435 [bacterium]|nr:hypothetical protein [bacterium]